MSFIDFDQFKSALESSIQGFKESESLLKLYKNEFKQNEKVRNEKTYYEWAALDVRDPKNGWKQQMDYPMKIPGGWSCQIWSRKEPDEVTVHKISYVFKDIRL